MRLRFPRRDPYAPARFRFPSLGPAGQRHLAFGITADMLLRGLAKLVAAVVIAGLGGLAIGTALAKLSGDSESPPGVSGDPPAAAPPVTTTKATTTTQARRKRTSTQPRKPANNVRVRVISAILHPASSASGKRRQRARLSVHVRVINRSTRRVVPSRPVLVSGDARVKTDPKQDTAATHIEALAPGATGDVTLRFETAGAVTQRLRDGRRARLTIAGRTVTATARVGSPISAGTAAREGSSSGTSTQSAPRPPPPPPVAAQPPAAPPPPPPPEFDSSR